MGLAKTADQHSSNLTAKQRRALKRNAVNPTNLVDFRFAMTTIKPLTETQREVFRLYDSSDVIMLDGFPGTGKTFLSMYLGLNHVMTPDSDSNGRSKPTEVLILRSAVQTRNQGFMPGNGNEKMSEFEAAYAPICSKLFEREDAFKVLRSRNQLSMMSTSFLRGQTLDNTVVIADECQSMNFHELKTIITRLGQNSKLLLCGDEAQDDLKTAGANRNDVSGMSKMRAILREMGRPIVTFKKEDIVRSGICKDFILAEEALKAKGVI